MGLVHAIYLHGFLARFVYTVSFYDLVARFLLRAFACVTAMSCFPFFHGQTRGFRGR